MELFLKQSDLQSDQTFFKNQAETWMEKLTSLFEKRLSCLELEVLFSIFNIMCEKHFYIFPKTVWERITGYSKNCLKQTETSLDGSCLLRPKICQLLLKLAVRLEIKQLEQSCCQMLLDRMYEVKHTVLDFLHHFFVESCPSDDFCEFFQSIDSELKDSCRTFLLENDKIVLEIVHLALSMFRNGKEHPEDKAKLLNLLGHWEQPWIKIMESSSEYNEDLLIYLLNLCRSPHDEVATSAMYCLIKFMKLKVNYYQLKNMNN
jgi:hypothetical protein